MKSNIFPLFLVLISACTLMKSGKTTKYTVGFYNLENLFDTFNDPAIIDEDFLSEGKNNWNQDRNRQSF